jgi:hypothetical protein
VNLLTDRLSLVEIGVHDSPARMLLAVVVRVVEVLVRLEVTWDVVYLDLSVWPFALLLLLGHSLTRHL